MFWRVSCLLCLLASTAAAELITISEGHYDRVNVPEGRELLFTGGSIEYLNTNGGAATIDGGELTGIFDTGSRVTWGGTVKFLSSGHIESFESVVDGAQHGRVNNVIFEGLQFRVVRGPDANSASSIGIQGVMLDGTPLQMSLFRVGNRSLHHVEFIDHPELIYDPTGDAMFDLEDLNIIRNNFGAQGGREQGDTDGDGQVGLSDLNIARNQFGNSWSRGPDYIFSGVWDFSPQAVPEPSTMLLGVLALLTTACTQIAYR